MAGTTKKEEEEEEEEKVIIIMMIINREQTKGDEKERPKERKLTKIVQHKYSSDNNGAANRSDRSAYCRRMSLSLFFFSSMYFEVFVRNVSLCWQIESIKEKTRHGKRASEPESMRFVRR